MTDRQSVGAVAAPDVARACAAPGDVRPITQIDFARAGIVTPQMAAVAAAEGREPEAIRAAVAAGRIAIPANIHHASLAPAGVGSTLEGVPLSTKVNVNLGISGDLADEALEWEKVDVALELGADCIMDLSNSGKTRAFRRALVEKSPAMIGTVPMYDAIGYWEKALIAITPRGFPGSGARPRRGRGRFRHHSRRHEPPGHRVVQRDGATYQYRIARRVAHLRLDGGHWSREPLL